MSKNQVDTYCKIMNVPQADIAEHIKKILSPPLSGWIKNYFIRTRNFELGICFVGICRMLISTCPTAFSQAEYVDYDITLSFIYLEMLDRSNKWYEYVQAFDDYRENKPYSLHYAKSPSKEIGTQDWNDEAFFHT